MITFTILTISYYVLANLFMLMILWKIDYNDPTLLGASKGEMYFAGLALTLVSPVVIIIALLMWAVTLLYRLGKWLSGGGKDE